jgi:hypothetical protein
VVFFPVGMQSFGRGVPKKVAEKNRVAVQTKNMVGGW